MEFRKITEAEYIAEYVPKPDWVLLEKDILPQVTAGGVFIPESVKKDMVKFSPTATIVAMSPSRIHENELYQFLMEVHYKVGDHVGYDATAPMMSPAPPYYSFDTSSWGKDGSKFVTIHISDLLNVFCETKEKKDEFISRFK